MRLFTTLLILASFNVMANFSNAKDSHELTEHVRNNLPQLMKLASSRVGIHFGLKADEMSLECYGVKSFSSELSVGTCIIDNEMGLWSVTVSNSHDGPKYDFSEITKEP